MPAVNSKVITKSVLWGLYRTKKESQVGPVKWGNDTTYEPVSFKQSVFFAGLKIMETTSVVEQPEVTQDGKIGFSKK